MSEANRVRVTSEIPLHLVSGCVARLSKAAGETAQYQTSYIKTVTPDGAAGENKISSVRSPTVSK
jgi:hypothetical protein